jgi:uncharacterized protein
VVADREPIVKPGLSLLPGRYAVCRLSAADPLPQWAVQGTFFSVTRTPAELSIVCDASAVPPRVQAESDWRILAVRGPLDFALTGIMAQLSGVLAALQDAGHPVERL